MSGKKVKQFRRQLKKGAFAFASEFIKEIESRKLGERLLIAFRIITKRFNQTTKK